MLAISEYAYDLLTLARQTTLPIQEEKVVETLGAELYRYSQAKEILQSLGHWEYAQTVSGLSFRFEGQAIICYADKLSLLQRRKVIMHECGHIHEGHIAKDGILGKSDDPALQDAQEAEADAFAVSALAPAHLLQAYGISTPEEIERSCRVSVEDAAIAAENLKAYIHAQQIKPAEPPHTHDWNMIAVVVIVAILAMSAWMLLSQKQTTPPAPNTPVTEPAPIPDDPEPVAADTGEDDPETTLYYWTRSGEVYHTREDCPALKQSALILSGTLDEAQLYKERACKFCGD